MRSFDYILSKGFYPSASFSGDDSRKTTRLSTRMDNDRTEPSTSEAVFRDYLAGFGSTGTSLVTFGSSLRISWALRGNRDERKTWSTLHLLSAENAGLPKQDIPAWQRSCCITRCRSVMDSADRLRYRQRDKCRAIGMKPDLSGGRATAYEVHTGCCGCADADRNSSRKGQAYVESRMQLETARTGSEGGIRVTLQKGQPVPTLPLCNEVPPDHASLHSSHLRESSTFPSLPPDQRCEQHPW